MADVEPRPTADGAFAADVIAGLSATPKAIPARWFYDGEGSALFEAITDLPEYYPTRTEAAILRDAGPALADAIGPGRAVIEFGSGSSAKTPLLLRAIAPAAYVPIDISADFLRESAAGIAQDYPGLPVLPVAGDFLRPLTLPIAVADLPKLGFFPGSTIGNLTPPDAVDLLRAMRANLGVGAHLVIGMDRVKDASVLIPAYDDAAGVTARFNLNLLARINRELGGDVPLDAFRHEVRWNDMAGRIEMHLLATRGIGFTAAGRRWTMTAGESLHTENSHKYGERDARLLLAAGGWTVTGEWTDPHGWFAVLLAEARPEAVAP